MASNLGITLTAMCAMLSLVNAADKGKPCPEINIDYYGNVVKRLDYVGSWYMCSRHCKNNEYCKSWSWYSQQHQCVLKSTDGRKTVDKVGVYSGPSECGESGHTLQEVQITGGKAGASSRYNAHDTWNPENAFIDSTKGQWASGRNAKGTGDYVRFPHLIWYEFPQPFIPGQISIGASAEECQAENGFCGATKYQLVGTNDSVCNKFSRWTVLCEDLSGELFKKRRENKYCKVDPQKRESFKCIGINVLESGYEWYVEMNGVRMWKLV